MTDITAKRTLIQQEDVRSNASLSSAVGKKIGESVNWIIQNSADQVGDIKASMLTESQFQAQRNTTWVLMDGRDVTGSDYDTLTGNAIIPDARGRFLRMQNNGTSINPDGTGLGGAQSDQVASHSHSVTVQARDTSNNGSQRIHTGIDTGGNLLNFGFTSSSFGGNETRPKSLTVNYFIKINEAV